LRFEWNCLTRLEAMGFPIPQTKTMKLEELLSQRATQILKRWTALIFDTYPSDAQRFLTKQKDPFANPVGSTLSREAENFFREFLGGADPERLAGALEGIIRVRAVQDFSPSGAVGFVFLLKKIIREETDQEIREQRIPFKELQALESRLDDAALAGFDVYVRCKEKVYEIRAREARNHVSGLLRRAGLLSEIPAWDSDGKNNDSTERS
jgi:RsbT co-antagonist protein rsbRD N-terminal domain